MAVLTMDRRASDNEYLHREFHNLLNLGLSYVADKYGDDAAREYMMQFTRSFYAPLIDEIKKDGFAPLKRHIEENYRIEEMPDAVSFDETENRLIVNVTRCPAIAFMQSKGTKIYKNYYYTSSIVYETLANDGNLKYEMRSYNPDTGAAEHVFTKGEL